MTPIGRNAPCPCGSGKKYKQCCLRAEDHRRALRSAQQEGFSKALAWLEKRYGREMDEALATGFFAGFERGELERKLSRLPEHIRGLLEINAQEWLLCEATIPGSAGEVPARDLVLGPGGADLPSMERSWIEEAVQRPLSLYEADRLEPGVGLSLRDLLREEEPPRWVTDRSASGSFREGDVLGARLAQSESEWKFTGAMYPLQRVAVPALLAELKEDEGSREHRWRAIVSHWIRALRDSAELDWDAFSEESAPFVRGKPEEARAEIRGSILREALRGFYQNWADEPLPVLGHKTPREAIGTGEGREAVVSLLHTYERDEARMAKRDQREPLDFGFLWEELGLPRK
jgi:hypothetical protein